MVVSSVEMIILTNWMRLCNKYYFSLLLMKLIKLVVSAHVQEKQALADKSITALHIADLFIALFYLLLTSFLAVADSFSCSVRSHSCTSHV